MLVVCIAFIHLACQDSAPDLAVAVPYPSGSEIQFIIRQGQHFGLAAHFIVCPKSDLSVENARCPYKDR